MDFDFSRCKTKEDVQKVFDNSPMITVECITCHFKEKVFIYYEGVTCSKCGSNMLRVVT